MTPAQVLALALQCSSVDPHLVLSIATQESGLQPEIVHVNRNGTRDFGLMQINETNFPLLHLTPASALDPCQSIRAAGDLIAILSRYNSGSPTRSIGYATQVVARLDAAKGIAPSPALPIAQRLPAAVRQMETEPADFEPDPGVEP
jgi:soluble lytic murein transglycosylase-like protein